MHEDFILPPMPESDEPFRLHLAGVSYCDGSYRIERSPGPVWVFEYIEAGHGTVCIEGETFHPGAGDVYVIPAWTTHHYYSSADAPWIKYWFNVSGRLVESLIEVYRLQGRHWFRNCPVGECFRLGQERLAHASPEVLWREAPGVIATIVHELARYSRSGRSVSRDGERLRHHLEKYLRRRPPALTELSAAIGKSPVQTIRIFKRDFGVSPIQYLLHRKMDAACELLTASPKSVKEIALALGFDDEYYFSRLFKRKLGVSPSHYRCHGAPGPGKNGGNPDPGFAIQ